jgi:DNA-binding CsgD family transcriptional regulator
MNKLPKLNIKVFTINNINEKEFETLIFKTFKHKTKTDLPEKFLVANNCVDISSITNDNTGKTMVILLEELDDTQNSYQEVEAEIQKVLSNREKEVLSYLALGNRYEKIAESLFISVHTVRFHIKKIYRKFNIHSQPEAIALAVKNGLVYFS